MRTTKTVLIGSLLALTGSAALATPWANEWTIGPIIRGKNYSANMPLQPDPTRNGWAFDFPYPNRSAGHVHYVSFDPGSLGGKSRIVVNYRVTADRRTQFVPQEQPQLAGTVSLVIQRRGDSWNAKGRYEHYRWHSPAEHVHEITPGVRRMVIDLNNPGWTSVLGKRAGDNPKAFRDSLVQTGKVGLVFGSSAARGHGVFATAPAKFELLSFDIE
jgi:hypothetical protein